MVGKRFLMKALVGLLVIALLIGGASSLQRNAWMQGYMMGQLGAGGDGGAALPYMAYGLQGYGGPGLGGGLAILLGIGLLALLFMGFSRVFLGRPWAMQGGPQGGAHRVARWTATSSRGSAWRRRTLNVPPATGGMARPGVGTRLTRSNQRQASRGQAGTAATQDPG